MKRNEKILVYGVTGFLLAILVIAVVFGNEDLTRAVAARSQPETPRTLQEMLIADPAAEEPGTDPETAEQAETDAGETTAPVEAAVPEPTELIGPLPLAMTPPVEAVSVLGKSRREGDYRIVTVQPRDTFSELVRHWCGSVDYEGRVERLNEGLVKSALRPGVDLWLPWVEDNVLLAAHEDRTVERAAAEAQRTREMGSVYTLRRGDSLWKLAQTAAGLAGAPAYIERIKALNPDIVDFDRLREGQQIRLPADR